MMRQTIPLTLLFLLATCVSFSEELTPEKLLQKMAEKADAMDQRLQNYGFYQESLSKELDEKGNVEKQHLKTYKTIWLENKPYAELVKVDGKDLDKKEKEKEADRKKEFLKSLKEKKKNKEDDEFTWKQLFAKYDYQMLPSDGSARYVVSFKPKNQGLTEKNRAEKIFNKLQGKIWIDEGFNMVQATARLISPVKFGFGVLAKIDSMQIEYKQKPYQDVWLPSDMKMNFQARMALVKNARREIVSRFFDVYQRPQ